MSARQRSQESWHVVVLTTIALPVMYFLSIGPAWWIMNHTSNSSVQVAVDYYFFPAYFVCWNCQPLRDLMEWYCGLSGLR